MSYDDVVPSSDELQDISAACQRLWSLDENRLVPGQDYTLNLGEGKRIFDSADVAEQKLFTNASPTIWEKRTYVILYHLLDNYQRETGSVEVEQDIEKQECRDFLSACMETKPMQYCFKYLVAKGVCEDDEGAFMKLIYQAWFSFYRRGDGEERDSCGFEHVFVGEVDEGHVKGLHNWIQACCPLQQGDHNGVQTMIEEARGNLEYMGAVLPRRRDASDDDDSSGERRLISIQLGWEGEVKDVSSMFVGTSPEFELALYSLCFFAGEEENRVSCGDYDLTIKCYRIRSKYGDKVSTCYPELD